MNDCCSTVFLTKYGSATLPGANWKSHLDSYGNPENAVPTTQLHVSQLRWRQNSMLICCPSDFAMK